MNYFYKTFLYLFIISALFLHSSSIYAQLDGMFGAHNYLLGKTGVAHDQSRVTSLPYNPAHISDIKRPELNLSSGLYYYMYSYRYPGDITRSSSKIDIAGIPLPLVAYPISKGFTLGGFLIPIPVETKITAKKIPLGLLGQLNLADLTGKAKLQMYIDLYSNIFKSSFLSIGTQISYNKYSAKVGVNANGYTGDHIVSVNLESSTLSLKLGVKAKITSRLYLGFSSVLYNMNTTSTAISTFLDADEDEDGEADNLSPTIAKSSVPIKNIRLGTTFKILPRLMLYLDLEYNRESASKAFSLIDFVEKDKDISDTLSAYLGSEFILSPTYQILAGAFYEPSSIGIGSPGKTGKVGFGFMDLAMGLGAPPSKPVWGVSAGIRAGFIKIPKKKQSSVFERYNPYYALTMDVGAVFSRTSIGIPSGGEQPATYEVTKVTIPVEVSYIF